MPTSTSKPTKLTPAQLEALAAERPAWQVTPTSMRRSLHFPDFVAAMGFVAQVALVAERANHHPTWTNTYGKVTIELSTHDAGGVTERDRELAAEIDRIAARMGAGDGG
ncbi:MAG: 4a-hydroxytetrahydrobiopterin dehydratase [Deltaproteobacteria bacterium]|nr:MAG: 4a-hydroxytetrahydrobiopterin dehydratase [Deltaproteobacteria bacterium]